MNSETTVIPLDQFIGTETCAYCGLDTECLTIFDESEACESCIQKAFKEYWGEDESLRMKGDAQL